MKNFLNLGRQPIANAFIKEEDFDDEFFYDLVVGFDEETGLVSLAEFVPPDKIFNENYAYHTSQSFPMVQHFKDIAIQLQAEFNPQRILEIGSNDGTFLKNWPIGSATAIEPCMNFCNVTRAQGYVTYPYFWDFSLAETVANERGLVDLVYAANCICHIQDLDDAFNGVNRILKDDGIFVFEDPSLESMLDRVSYDQIYDEHAHIFSIYALSNLLKKHGLKIFRIQELDAHGGSNRIYATRDRKVEKHFRRPRIAQSVECVIERELSKCLDSMDIMLRFENQVQQSRIQLKEMLQRFEEQGKKVISIGATSKSTTVFNFCRFDSGHMQLVTDTTPDKIGLFTPGTHIPIVDRQDVNLNDYDYAFLGAWNFQKEILKKESEFVGNGGQFITHVPRVGIYENSR